MIRPIATLCAFAFTSMAYHAFGQISEKPNIIMIIADDLNDYIEVLHANPDVHTPHINRIAGHGTTFYNAYCASPVCAASRTSFLTGKDVAYTGVYGNHDYKCNGFDKNFTTAGGNETYFTLPGYLKDSAGYFTYNINKVFHCHNNLTEYDDMTEDPCEKKRSWNKYTLYDDTTIIFPIAEANNEGVGAYNFGRLSDTLEDVMMDHVAVDSAISFIQNYSSGPGAYCDKPFFIALGLHEPHKDQFVPEKYFSPFYSTDIYTEPYNYSYNFPANAWPQNGIIPTPQPDTPWADLYALPENGVTMSMVKNIDTSFMNWTNGLATLPEIDPLYTESMRIDVLTWSQRANALMAYLAAVNYIDAQVGRLLDELEAHPEILDNTIIIFMGDHGHALGEKKHWGKNALWETDIRTSLIIADYRNPQPQITTRMVNLFDLFPTLCDLSGVPYPVFENGTSYLDGITLTPLLEQPNQVWERPVLTSLKKDPDDEASCFPQYSIRDERFHYIRYTANGGGPGNCDMANSFHEEELYEIGTDRKTDPNEWHNLINNDDYAPVVSYLQQWLPDSNLYLQKTFKAIIETNPLDCFAAQDDTLHLSFEWFDTDGNIAIPSEALNYTWSNNLTPEIVSGTSAEFHFNSIDDDVFENNNRIMIYLQVFDPSGHIIAFDTRYFYFNSGYAPDADFSVLSGGGFTAHVSDFAIEGQYQRWWWDFGNGEQFFNEVPGPYTFDSPGTYPITLYFSYGNGCIDSATHTFTTGTYNYVKDKILHVIPNPAHDQIHVMAKEGVLFGNMYIYNLEGRLVKQINAGFEGVTVIPVDISDLNNGIYFIRYNSPDQPQNISFVVAR